MVLCLGGRRRLLADGVRVDASVAAAGQEAADAIASKLALDNINRCAREGRRKGGREGETDRKKDREGERRKRQKERRTDGQTDRASSSPSTASTGVLAFCSHKCACVPSLPQLGVSSSFFRVFPLRVRVCTRARELISSCGAGRSTKPGSPAPRGCLQARPFQRFLRLRLCCRCR